MFTNCLGITPYLSSVTWQAGWKYFAVKGTEVWRWSNSHEGSLLISDRAWAPSSFSFPSCAQWPSVSQARSCQCSRILFSLVLCSIAVTIRSRRSAQGKLCGWWEKRELAERRRGLDPNPLRGAQVGMMLHREVRGLWTSCIFTSATLCFHISEMD